MNIGTLFGRPYHLAWGYAPRPMFGPELDEHEPVRFYATLYGDVAR